MQTLTRASGKQIRPKMALPKLRRKMHLNSNSENAKFLLQVHIQTRKFKQIQGYKRANPWHGKQANDARVEGYPSHTGTQSHAHDLSIPFIRMICELCAWPPFPSPQCPQRFYSTIQGTLCRQQAMHIAEQKADKQRISCSQQAVHVARICPLHFATASTVFGSLWNLESLGYLAKPKA